MAVAYISEVSRSINLSEPRVYSAVGNCCVYCGTTTDLCRDHVIPTSYKRQKRRYEGDWLVSACRECNSILSDRVIFNIPDRAAFILAKFRMRHAKRMRALKWDNDELNELSGSLRQYVLACQSIRAELVCRADHLMAVARMPKMYLVEFRPFIEDQDEEIEEFKT